MWRWETRCLYCPALVLNLWLFHAIPEEAQARSVAWEGARSRRKELISVPCPAQRYNKHCSKWWNIQVGKFVFNQKNGKKILFKLNRAQSTVLFFQFSHQLILKAQWNGRSNCSSHGGLLQWRLQSICITYREHKTGQNFGITRYLPVTSNALLTFITS